MRELSLLVIVFAGALGCARRVPPPLPPSRAAAFCRDAASLVSHPGAGVIACEELLPDFFSVDLGRRIGNWYVFLDGGAVRPCRADLPEGFVENDVGAGALARHLRRIRAYDREGSLTYEDLQRASWIVEALPPHFPAEWAKWVGPIPDTVPGLRFHPFTFTVPARLRRRDVEDIKRWKGAPIPYDVTLETPRDLPPEYDPVRATLRGDADEPFVWRVEALIDDEGGRKPRWELVKVLPLERSPASP